MLFISNKNYELDLNKNLDKMKEPSTYFYK